MIRRRWFLPSAAVGVAIVLCADAAPALATDPIDLDLNPVTGLIEAVAVSSTDGDRLRHLEDPGQGDAVVDTFVSADPAADSRIAIKATGESWVVWQDEITSQIRYSYRDSTSRTWTLETTLSLPGEISGHPTVVHNGSETCVAYEIGLGAGRSVVATRIEDSPEPFPTRTILATTASAGELSLTLHAEAGQVWLTWRDLPGLVTWSKYDRVNGSWTAPQVESIGVSPVSSALTEIRTKALAP